MSRFDVEICGSGDIEAFMTFAKDEWDSSHIMANSRAYVDYFFYNKKRGSYNILLALDAETRKIEGFIAYVPASLYDADIKETDEFVWITNWLVTEKARSSGILLYMKMLSILKCKNIGTVGQNETAEAIYERMKFKTGRLEQYFITKQIKADSALPFICMDEEQIRVMERHSAQYPKKTAEYIINKYLKSPYYKYYAYGVTEAAEIKGALIFRIQEYPDCSKRCLRVVEYFGELSALTGKGGEFQALLEEFNAEYIDFYCMGISEEILFSSGFERNDGAVLLPNYFEPLVNKNIEIRYAYKLENTAPFTVYKGDCDREFPRLY